MRILYITGLHPKPWNLESGIFITHRLRELKNQSVDVTVVAPVVDETWAYRLTKKILGKSGGKWPDRIEHYLGVVYKIIPIKVTLYSRVVKFHQLSRLFAEMILEKFDVCSFDLIHVHWLYPHGHAVKLISDATGVPYVATAHGSDINILPQKRPRTLPLVLETLEGASKAIFVSEGLLKKARQLGYKKENAVVIPNGVDTNFFHPMDKTAVKKELGIYRDNYKYVGFVGNLTPVKRADKLPEIFHLIQERVSKVHFIIVGDGYLRNKIEKETEDLEMTFTGRVAHQKVAKWMNAMDVMILPSRNEGWPCVVLEAQACGTCVVGSNNGGIPEAIGFEEYVVEEGEHFEERFAQKVVEVLEEGYDRKVLLNRAKEYAWENIVLKEKQMYEKVLRI